MYTVSDYISWIAQISSLPTTGPEAELIRSRLNDAYVEFVSDMSGITRRETVTLAANTLIFDLGADLNLIEVKQILQIEDAEGIVWKQVPAEYLADVAGGFRQIPEGNAYWMPGLNELYLAKALTESTDVTITYLSRMPLELVTAVTSTVAAKNERQRLRSTPSSGITIISGTAFTLSLATGPDTSSLTIASSAANVKSALEALPGIGAGNVDVTGTIGSGGIDLTIEFKGALAATNMALALVATNALRYSVASPAATGTAISTYIASVNHKVRLIATGASITAGDTFIPRIGATVCPAVAYDCSDDTLAASLETVLGSGTVSVTKLGSNITNGYDIELIGPLAGAPFGSAITISGSSSLTGTWADSSFTVTNGVIAVDEVNLIPLSLPATPTGGTFTVTMPLSGGGETTAAIAYGATKNQIADAIMALAGVTGYVTVSTPLGTGTMQIRLAGQGLTGPITLNHASVQYNLALAISLIEDGSPSVPGGVDVAETTMSSIPKRYHYDGVCNLALAKVFEYDQVDLKRAMHHRNLAMAAKTQLYREIRRAGGDESRIRKGLDHSW